MHFKSKCELVKALLASVGEEGYALWTPLGELAQDPTREAVRAWLEWLIEWWTASRQSITIYLQASSTEPELIADQADADRRNLERVVELVPRFQSEDGRVEAMLLVAQLERFFYFWIVRGWEMEREQVVALLTETWWRALNGGDAGSRQALSRR
jgi:AcrR family transcriptional regulator